MSLNVFDNLCEALGDLAQGLEESSLRDDGVAVLKALQAAMESAVEASRRVEAREAGRRAA